MKIASKGLLVKEMIGWFMAGLAGDFVVIILIASLVALFGWEWMVIPGAVLCVLIPVFFAAFGFRQEVRRQKVKGIRPRPKDLQHPFFGILKAECAGDENDQWLGEMPFKPIAAKIGVVILASYDGPSAEQVKFVEAFKRDFERWFVLAEPKLKELLEAFGNTPVETDLRGTLSLVTLTIPRHGDVNEEWDMAFDSPLFPEHVFEVGFKNGQPCYSSYD